MHTRTTCRQARRQGRAWAASSKNRYLSSARRRESPSSAARTRSPARPRARAHARTHARTHARARAHGQRTAALLNTHSSTFIPSVRTNTHACVLVIPGRGRTTTCAPTCVRANKRRSGSLWLAGRTHKQPLSSLASCRASHSPRHVCRGRVCRNVESWCAVTSEPTPGFLKMYLWSVVHVSRYGGGGGGCRWVGSSNFTNRSCGCIIEAGATV